MNKVRAGSIYIYDPVGWDRVDLPYDIKKYDVVKVVNLYGCPKANTMGHCHVNHLDGTFAGLVHVNSLTLKSKWKEVHEKLLDEAQGEILSLEQKGDFLESSKIYDRVIKITERLRIPL